MQTFSVDLDNAAMSETSPKPVSAPSRIAAVPAPHAAWWRLWHEPPEAIDAGWVRAGVAKLIARGAMPPAKAVQAYPKLMAELGSVGGRFRLYRLLVETATFESPQDPQEIYWFAGPADMLHAMLTAVGLLYRSTDLENLPQPPRIEHDIALSRVLGGLVEATRECLHPDSLEWLARCGGAGTLLDLRKMRSQRHDDRNRRVKPRLGMRAVSTATWSGQAEHARYGMAWLDALLKERRSLLQRLQVRLPREWTDRPLQLSESACKRLSPSRVWLALTV